MNNIWKRSLSMLLALVMVVGMLPMGVLAEEQETSDAYTADVAIETADSTCAEGHDWGVWEPTDDETAEYRVCAACGEIETYVYEVVETVVAEEAAAAVAASTNVNEADALIWLDADRQDDLYNKIANSQLDDMILKALGISGYATVKYNGVNVGDFLDLVRNQDKITSLKDAIKAHELITFTVAQGSTQAEYKIAFRSTQYAQPTVALTDAVIEGKTAPADLEAKIQAALDSAVVTLEYKYDDNAANIHVHEIIPHGLAKAVAETSAIDTTWPAASKESVAATVTLTIKDDLDGTTVVSGEGKVVLKNTTPVYTITYTDGEEDVFADVVYTVVEGEPVPSYTPSHPAFIGWNAEVPDVAEGNVTLSAVWQKYTITYTDGVDEAEIFADQTFSVLKGEATPIYRVTANYNGRYFSHWNPDVASSVYADATYEAVWAVDDSILVYYHDADTNEFFTWKLKSDNTAWYFGEDYMDKEYAVFAGWFTRTELGNGKYEYTPWEFETEVTENLDLYAVYADDINNNNVADIDEGSVLTFENLVGGDISVNGNTITILGQGYITVPGLYTAKDEFNNTVYKFLGDGTTITVKPWLDNGISWTYIAGILVDGKEQALEYQDDFSVQCVVTRNPGGIATAAAANDNDLKVEIIFAEADMITYKNDIDILPGVEYSAEEVYDAVVAGPVRQAGDEITVQYKAREERDISVDMSGLKELLLEYKDIAAEAGYDVEEIYKDAVGEDNLYEVPLTELWLDYNERPEGIAKTAQDVVNAYIAEVKANPMMLIQKAMGNTEALADELLADIKAELEKAEIEPFAYNADGGKNISESIKVTSYKNDKQYIENDEVIDVAIQDDRQDTVMTISKKAFTVYYGAFSDNDILKNVTVTAEIDGKLNVKPICVPLAGLDAGSYKAVKVTYKGDETYKPCSATFDLTINKGKATLEVPFINVDHGKQYDASPIVKPADVEYLSVIVGLDLTEADLDLSKDDLNVEGTIPGIDADVDITLPVSAYMKNVRPKAWIKAPQAVKDMLENRGIDTSKDRTYTLAEIEQILVDNQEYLEKVKITEDRLNYILKAMHGVAKLAEVEMSITFDESAAPADAGIYFNAAVITDGNYEMAYDANLLLVQPIIGLPNQGGVQLFLRENGEMVIENIFERPNTGKEYALGVSYKGEEVYDATVYYYGLTSGLAVHYTTNAPSKPGVYAAATVYNTYNEKGELVQLGSDAAVIIIGLDWAYVEVPSIEAVEYDGQPHKATIKVYDEDDNEIKDAALTIITGTADSDNMSANIGMQDLSANVNIDFPKALDNAWPTFAAHMESKLGVTYPTDITTAEVAPEDIQTFLTWCDEQIDKVAYKIKSSDYPEDILNSAFAEKVFNSKYWDKIENKVPKSILDKMGAPDEAVSEIQAQGHRIIEKIRGEVSKLNLPKDVTITFRDDVRFTARGFYLYCAIVTDPDYLPDVDAGVLVIKAPEDYYMIDTTVIYDGKEHVPAIVDETGRDGVDMFIDRAGRLVNIDLSEDQAAAFIERLEAKFGITIEGNAITLGELYAKVENGAMTLTEAIIEHVQAVITARLNSEGYITDTQINEAIAKLAKKFTNLETKIFNKIKSLETYEKYQDITIAVNGNKPVNVGEYQFFGVTYAVDATEAILAIKPAEIVVTAPNDTVMVGTEVGSEAGQYDIVLKIAVKDVDGKLVELDVGSEQYELYKKLIAADYKLYDNENETYLSNALKTAGQYTIIPSSNWTADKKNYTVDTVNGTLTVEDELGTISSGEWRMDLDSVVYLNYYPTLDGFAENFDFANRGGVIIWTGDEAPSSRYDIEAGKANTVDVKGMKQNADGEWYVQSLEIFAKNLGDRVYIRPYVVAADGSYVYQNGAPWYSAAYYCYDMLSDAGSREDTRAVCAALLEYGASAQNYFSYETDNLVTDIPEVCPDQNEPDRWVEIDLNDYDLTFYDSYLDDVVVDDLVRKLSGNLTGMRGSITMPVPPTLDLQGAIRLTVGYNIDTNTIDVDNIAKAEVFFWTRSQLEKLDLDALDYDNLSETTYSCQLTKATGNEEVYLGDYRAKSDHILAKNLSETVYYTCRITMNDGTVYRSGLGYYSPEGFVYDHLNDGNVANVDTVCERIAVYSEMARIRFAS